MRRERRYFSRLVAPIDHASRIRHHVSPLPPCRGCLHSYNPPMLDVKLIRDQPDLVRERLASRGAGDETKIAEVLSPDERRRKSIAEGAQLKADRNRVSKEIGVLLGQKKAAEAEARKAETRRIGEQISQ